MKSFRKELWFHVPNRMESPQIFYGEFDGRRKKRGLVKILGE